MVGAEVDPPGCRSCEPTVSDTKVRVTPPRFHLLTFLIPRHLQLGSGAQVVKKLPVQQWDVASKHSLQTTHTRKTHFCLIHTFSCTHTHTLSPWTLCTTATSNLKQINAHLTICASKCMINSAQHIAHYTMWCSRRKKIQILDLSA